jgi:hypothetical protein
MPSKIIVHVSRIHLKARHALILSIALAVGAAFTAAPSTAIAISKEKSPVHDPWVTTKESRV